METQTTERIESLISIGTFSLPLSEYFPDVIRREYTKEKPQITAMIPEYQNESYSLETEAMEEIPEKSEYLYRETIREWWVGHVLKVHKDEGYFVAHLKDIKGKESIAEFNIDSAFEDSADMSQYLLPGAEFAFFVVTRHGRGNPETISRIEFTSPYIWKEEDNEKVKELYKELFPDDLPLED